MARPNWRSRRRTIGTGAGFGRPPGTGARIRAPGRSGPVGPAPSSSPSQWPAHRRSTVGVGDRLRLLAGLPARTIERRMERITPGRQSLHNGPIRRRRPLPTQPVVEPVAVGTASAGADDCGPTDGSRPARPPTIDRDAPGPTGPDVRLRGLDGRLVTIRLGQPGRAQDRPEPVVQRVVDRFGRRGHPGIGDRTRPDIHGTRHGESSPLARHRDQHGSVSNGVGS